MQGAFGEHIGVPGSVWVCSQCTFINEEEAGSICQVCQFPCTVSEGAAAEDVWQCSACTFINGGYGRQVCEQCETPRTSRPLKKKKRGERQNHALEAGLPPLLPPTSLDNRTLITLAAPAEADAVMKLPAVAACLRNHHHHKDPVFFRSEAGALLFNYSSVRWSEKVIAALEAIFPPPPAVDRRIDLSLSALSSPQISQFQVTPSPLLQSSMRPYQVRALAWMVKRELPDQVDHEYHSSLWRTHSLVDGTQFQVCRLTQTWLFDGSSPPMEKPVRGGILADEMGLGKTLTVLALCLRDKEQQPPGPLHSSLQRYESVAVSSKSSSTFESDQQGLRFACLCGFDHKKADLPYAVCAGGCGTCFHTSCYMDLENPSRHEKLCMPCQNKAGMVQSPATLLVVPSSLLKQWLDEVEKHIVPGGLRVFVYTSVSDATKQLTGCSDPRAAASISQSLRPLALAYNYDLIFATYEALEADFLYFDLAEKRDLRQPKRFPINLSALSMLEFHRVVMDESQIVNFSATKKSRAASWLSSARRWCVSGTPMGDRVADLHGSLVFLKHDPLCSVAAWNRTRPDDVVACFASGMMWRTSKSMLRHTNELLLPRIVVKVQNLSLSVIEQTFYDGVAQATTAIAPQLRLQHLREAAIHPSIGVMGLTRSVRSVASSRSDGVVDDHEKPKTKRVPVASLRDLLEQLIKQARLTRDQCIRDHIAGLHGWAGLLWAAGDVHGARNKYEEVVQVIKKADDLLSSPAGHAKIDELQRIHLAHNYGELLATCFSSRNNIFSSQALEAERRYCAVNRLSLEALVAELPSQVPEVLDWAPNLSEFSAIALERDFPALCERARANRVSVRTVAEEFFACVSTHLGRAISSIKRLCSVAPTEQQLAEAAQCGVCRSERQSGPPCENCTTYVELIAPLDKAFEGLHVNGSLHQALMEFYGSELRTKLEATKDDLDVLKRASQLRDSELKSRDMVTQCKLRFTATDDAAMALGAFVLRSEIPLRMATLEADCLASKQALEKSQAKLELLADEFNQGSPICPICSEPAGDDGFLFPCQHLLCRDCFKGWKDEASITCPLCRTVAAIPSKSRSSAAAVAVAGTTTTTTTTTTTVMAPAIRRTHAPTIPVRPDLAGLGVKIDAIVRQLMDIGRNSNEKVVCFSTFDRALCLIAQALDGRVHYALCAGGNKKDVTKRINEFKTDAEVKVLLLPFRHGGQGLNLIEARHVVFVEPLLDRSLERQAVARVHRMGQLAGEVFVYRFIVRGTVEEKVLAMHAEAGRGELDAVMDLDDGGFSAAGKDFVDDAIVVSKLL